MTAVVDLVGGPFDGLRNVPAVLDTLAVIDPGYAIARYERDEVGEALHLHPRYRYVPPSGGFRGQCSCSCGKRGCPNYGVDV